MANLVNLESVSKSFGVRPLLDGVSLGVGDGDRIGVVGLNGGGKTTLLEVLTGLEAPDEGRVSQTRDLRMAVVTQRTELRGGLDGPGRRDRPARVRRGARVGVRRASTVYFGRFGHHRAGLGLPGVHNVRW